VTTRPMTVTTRSTTATTRSATTTTAGSGSGGCGGAVLCAGFEDQTGSALAPGRGWSVAANSCGGSSASTVVVDHARAHRGTTSLRIDGGGGYCASSFATPTADVAGLGPVRYLRFFVNHAKPLPSSHVTFVAMHDQVDGKDLRIGGQNGALQLNRESTDATLPEQSPAGVAQSRPLATDRWTCVELGVDSSGSGPGRIDTWVDGAAVPGLTADGVATHDLDGQWVAGNWRPQLSDLRLGWQSYGNDTDTLWFDDVALSRTRIGC
jgi:hypothetical protein